ncbi:WXG100 family type VII secretion target [Streptomyces sp. SP17BM10]|uniref:WXG100 family type VII secretion target n=1 Tax=Streptomyces sp. SP17BM10 TaxID=3002530 RepID=UPI002E784D97|nr:WXG100 family type VII secretion target [Streptomyces sp. SP17BM10]MEE1785547.1 WXG100 family type VII secretion target [Streptomyces sp. SP17BM10]
MSANQFTMTAQEMQAFAKHIEEVIGQIGQERTKLNNTVEHVGVGWGGQAAEAYKALQHRFNEDIDALNGSLKAIKDAIELTTKYYAETEAQQQQQFGGARS